jgi:tetratricopeptide (TPR) repeat protein
MELFYNPDLMPEDEIKATFVAREALVDELVSLVEHQPDGAGVQHALIIAPRGMGKTTVLLMVRFALKDRGLGDRWLAVKFPEESYGVYDLADFWLEALDLLAAATNDELLRERSGRLKSDYPKGDDLQEAALALIKDWCREHSKRLVLLVDNLDMILEQINDERDNARLRDVLMNDGRIMMIGCAVSFFREARDYDQPLYNFFKIFELNNLRFDEMQELLRRRARSDERDDFAETLKANRSRLRVLEYFTGGNPRLVLMLYRVVTHSDITEVRRGLEKLLDEVTPYYKAKVESLPPQQRKVLDHIARVSSKTSEGATPSQIAEATRLTPNHVSAQLKRLSENGYVRAAAVRGRSSYYTLSEPLYAIWHQMRMGRDAHRRMRWLVDFLKVWYDTEELGVESTRLEERFTIHLEAGRLREATDVLEHRLLLAEAMEGQPHYRNVMDGVIRGYAEIGDTETLKSDLIAGSDLNVLSGETSLAALYRAGCVSEQDFERTEALLPSSSAGVEQPDAVDGIQLGLVALSAGRFDEAVRHFDRVLKCKPDSYAAWYKRGNALLGLGKYEEAITSYDRAVEIKPEDAAAWNNRGNALFKLGRYEEGITSYDRAVEIKAEHHAVWYNRGNALLKLGRYEEAITSYDRAVEIEPENDLAWNNRGNALFRLGRYEEAITSYDRAVEIKPEHDAAWNNRGNALSELGRHEEAITSYDRAVEIKPEDDMASYNRGITLVDLERHNEAIDSYDRAVEINSEKDWAWSNRGIVLFRLGRYEEAIDSINRAIEIRPQAVEIWRIRTLAYLTRLTLQVEIGKLDSARADWSEALKSSEHLDTADWIASVATDLARAARSGHFEFIRQLIAESDLEEQLFPLALALDHLASGDETLVDKLSPEVRGIVEEIVASLRKSPQHGQPPTKGRPRKRKTGSKRRTRKQLL